MVGDRTLADQQLETLRRAGDVLLFKLGSVGEEDTAIMLTSGISPHVCARDFCVAPNISMTPPHAKAAPSLTVRVCGVL